jgi:hypothetical protein
VPSAIREPIGENAAAVGNPEPSVHTDDERRAA